MPALATRIRHMQTGMGAMLFGLMVFWWSASSSIVGAGVREAQLEPGAHPIGQERAGAAAIVMAVTGVAVVLASMAWQQVVEHRGEFVCQPSSTSRVDVGAQLERPATLSWKIKDPGWV